MGLGREEVGAGKREDGRETKVIVLVIETSKGSSLEDLVVVVGF